MKKGLGPGLEYGLGCINTLFSFGLRKRRECFSNILQLTFSFCPWFIGQDHSLQPLPFVRPFSSQWSCRCLPIFSPPHFVRLNLRPVFHLVFSVTPFDLLAARQVCLSLRRFELRFRPHSCATYVNTRNTPCQPP